MQNHYDNLDNILCDCWADEQRVHLMVGYGKLTADAALRKPPVFLTINHR